MKESGPDEIQELFEAHRSADRLKAPRLRELLTSPSRPDWANWRLWQPAGAVLVLLLIASAVLVIRLDSPPAGTPRVLSEWRSPTDFLLGLRADNLLDQAPRLADHTYPSSTLSAFASGAALRPDQRDPQSQKKESREDR